MNGWWRTASRRASLLLTVLGLAAGAVRAVAGPRSTSRRSARSILRSVGDAEKRRDSAGNVFAAFRVDVTARAVEMRLKDDAGGRIGDFGKLATVLGDPGKLLFATNGGMFTPAYEPVGLFVQGGREVSPLNRSPGDGNFFLTPNGVFAVAAERAMVLTTDAFASLPAKARAEIKFATQSGPMLVVDGAPHPSFQRFSKNRAIRSGVGQLSPTVVVFAISEAPVTFMELADLFRIEYGCQNALYLDGAISKFWLPALGQTDPSGDFGVLVSVTR